MKLNSILLVVFVLLLSSCGDSGGDGFESNNDSGQFGPTAYYAFNEIDGSIAYNSEFDAFHGSIVAASRESGKIGNALNFSNVEGSHVLFDICCYEDPDTGEGDMRVSFSENTLTLAAWLKPTAMSIDTNYPIFGGSDYGVQSMKLRVNNGAVEFLLFMNNSGAVSVITSTSTLENNVWTHVAVTYNGSQAMIYFNGIEDNYSNITMPIRDIVNDYYIGGIPVVSFIGPGEPSFPGLVDEFLVSTIEFNPSEVEELYQEGI